MSETTAVPARYKARLSEFDFLRTYGAVIKNGAVGVVLKLKIKGEEYNEVNDHIFIVSVVVKWKSKLAICSLSLHYASST